MAMFAPVCPPHFLEAFSNKGNAVLGRYHLLLAHDIVANPSGYKKAFAKVSKDYHFQPRIIIDNSIVECGNAIDSNMMREAAKIISDCLPNVEYRNVALVLADVMADSHATWEASKECMILWDQDPVLRNYEWVFVAQGSNNQESMKLTTRLMASHWSMKIQTIAVPRIIALNTGSRVSAAKFASYYRPVHLLGFSNSILDDIRASRYAQGIDSAVPIRCAKEWDPFMSMGPRGDWWETGVFTNHTLNNLQTARNIFGGDCTIKRI